MKVIDDDDDDFDFDDDDDDERKSSKKVKFVSNARSGHDDQFCPKIVKIGAILAIFRPFEDFGIIFPGCRAPISGGFLLDVRFACKGNFGHAHVRRLTSIFIDA